MGTRILLAGGEDEFMMETLLKCKARFILCSYFYLRKKWKGSMQELCNYFKEFEFVLLDSGAFTLFSKPDLTYEEVYAYANGYAEFIEQVKSGVSAAVELDLYEIGSVGDKAHKLRTDILDPTGCPILPVYHGKYMHGYEHKLSDWEYFCKNYKYVGIASGMIRESPAKLAQLSKTAEKHGAVIHGFGITRQNYIKACRFFTCDSSVSGDTLVSVRANGVVRMVRIDNLYETLGEGELSGVDTLTMNGTERQWMPLQAVIRHKTLKPMARVCLEGGREITLTADHSMIQMDSEGNYVEVMPSELKVGDYVLQVDGACFGEELAVSDDLFIFMGLWCGDGWFIKESNGIGMSCANDPECLEVVNRVAKAYSANVTVRDNGVDCYLYSGGLVSELKKLGCVSGSSNKEVPHSVLSASKRQAALFLKGYFSADGYCGEVYTVSKVLAHGVAYLLGAMGWVTSMANRPSHSFSKDGKVYSAKEATTVSIQSVVDLKEFRDTIGYLQEYKYEALKEFMDSRCSGSARGAYRKGVPVDYANSTIVRAGKGWNSVKRHKGQRANRVGNEGRFHPDVLGVDALFVRVKSVSVELPEEPVAVYDLAVPGSQKFIGNGILVHNTAWTNGQRFGTHYVFEVSRLRIYSNLYKQSARRRNMKRWEREGFDLTGLEKDATHPFVTVNCYEWVRFQNFIYGQVSRDYWDQNLEVNPMREGKPVVVDKVKTPRPPTDETEEVLEEDFMDEIPEEEEVIPVEFEVLTDSKGDGEDHVPSLIKPNEITSFEALFSVEDGKEYRFFDSQQKIQWKSIFKHEDYGLFERRYCGKNGEGWTERQIYRNLEEKELPEPVVDYNKYLRSKFHEGVLRGQESGAIQSRALAVRGSKDIMQAVMDQAVMCDDCYLANRCDGYKEGAKCAFNKRIDITDAHSLADSLNGLLSVQFARTMKAALIEKQDGGVTDKAVSDEIKRTFEMVKDFKEIMTPPDAGGEDSITIKTKGKQATEGVLSKLFKGGDGE